MCGGGGGTTYVQQPAANPPDYEMSPEEKRLLAAQSGQIEAMIPGIQQYVQNVLPLETQRGAERFLFTDPILRGESLPGIYGQLSEPLGVGVEEEMFRRGADRTKAELNKLGLLNSGVTAELLNKQNTAIAMESAVRRRAELANLINLSMGVPMTALPTAQTASQSAQQAIMGLGAGQRAYELNAANISRPTYGYAPPIPSPWKFGWNANQGLSFGYGG